MFSDAWLKITTEAFVVWGGCFTTRFPHQSDIYVTDQNSQKQVNKGVLELWRTVFGHSQRSLLQGLWSGHCCTYSTRATAMFTTPFSKEFSIKKCLLSQLYKKVRVQVYMHRLAAGVGGWSWIECCSCIDTWFKFCLWEYPWSVWSYHELPSASSAMLTASSTHLKKKEKEGQKKSFWKTFFH